MTRKHLSGKWKAIICCIAIIAVMAGTGVTVWAIARNYYRYNADFEVNITGGRYVNASVRGQSFLAGSSEALESHTATFNSDTANETTELSFATPITMQNDEQVAKLRFEVTNNSPYSNHSDLIIKPTVESIDVENVIIVWYYSLNNVSYKAYPGEYLVAHKGDTLYLELRMLATMDLFGQVNFEDSVSIDLRSEMDETIDFEYDYDYSYDSSTEKATKTKVCPTCGRTESPEEMSSTEYEVVTSNLQYSGYSVKNKVLFVYESLMTTNNGAILFDCGVENVTIVGERAGFNVSLEFVMFDYYEESACKNIKVQDITFSYVDDFGIKVTTMSNDSEPTWDPVLLNFTIQDCSFDTGGVWTGTAISILSKSYNVKIIDSDFEQLAGAVNIPDVTNFAFVGNSSYQMGGIILSMSKASGDIYIIDFSGHESSSFFSCRGNNANVYFLDNVIEKEYPTFIHSASQISSTWTIYNNQFYEMNSNEPQGRHDMPNSKLCIESGSIPGMVFDEMYQ